ncbi:hypothetical protein [Epilithonimonas mollis]|uniref:Uncharacterized protein n=1 Tax=Epilithonimonas mollis TaxID=216903 RepID=A0A1M6Q0T4_9FLAO|nr:hypothetical protein [Epilithonimonas mollis]SHK13757.1 hypothetical protein SAMN05444371_1447 [Epilithonimonas mollis]
MMKKALTPETFLKKTLTELQDLLVLLETEPSIKDGFPFPTLDASLKNGSLNLFGIEKPDPIFKFIDGKCFLIKTNLTLQEAKEITLLLHDFFPDTFRFLSLENFKNFANVKFYNNEDDDFPRISNMEIFSGLDDDLDFENLYYYKSISAMTDNSIIALNLNEGEDPMENYFSLDIIGKDN